MRSDFSILTKSNILIAKPKIGYSISEENYKHFKKDEFKIKLATYFMEIPYILEHTMSIKDAIIEMFIRDTNTLFITENEYLTGIISKTDLLKFSLETKGLETIPISVAMTRKEHIVFANDKTLINEVIEQLYLHNIESIPIVTYEDSNYMKIIGQINKSIATKLLYELIKT